MIKDTKEEIIDQVMHIGGKIHDLMTDENQEDVYEVIDALYKLKDKVFGI